MKKATILMITAAFTAASVSGHANTLKIKKKSGSQLSSTISSDDLSAKTPALAAGEENESVSPLSAEFILTSNYIFRGISQSNNLPAIQGGLTYTFLKPGIYFNLWGTNVYIPTPNGDTATVEFDTIAGIRNTIADMVSYDLAFARYNYPKSPLSYNEILAGVSYSFLFIKTAFSNNVYNTHETGRYYSGGINYNIPAKYIFGLENMTFIGSMGHNSLPLAAGSSYNDFSLLLSKKFKKIYTVALQWTGTNGHSNTGSLGDDHLVASVIVDV